MSEFPRRQRHHFPYLGMEYGAYVDVLIHSDLSVTIDGDNWGALEYDDNTKQVKRCYQPADLYELLNDELKNVCLK